MPNPIEELSALCMSRVSSADGALHYDEAALKAITAAFDALRVGPQVEEAVRELLFVAFFFSEKKGAPAASEVLVRIAHRAVPNLAASGRDLASVWNSDKSRERQRVLGDVSNRSAAKVTGSGPTVFELMLKTKR